MRRLVRAARFEVKKMGLLENSPYQHSSQCHPALATKSIKKRLQPVEVAAVL